MLPFIGVQGDSVVVMGIIPKMTGEEAVKLAAQLVAIAEVLVPGGAREAFEREYEAILGS